MELTKTQKKSLTEALDKLADARSLVGEVKDELDETYGNKSEKWQQSEKGEELQSKIDSLDDAYGSIESVEDDINGIIGAID